MNDKNGLFSGFSDSVKCFCLFNKECVFVKYAPHNSLLSPLSLILPGEKKKAPQRGAIVVLNGVVYTVQVLGDAVRDTAYCCADTGQLVSVQAVNPRPVVT